MNLSTCHAPALGSDRSITTLSRPSQPGTFFAERKHSASNHSRLSFVISSVIFFLPSPASLVLQERNATLRLPAQAVLECAAVTEGTARTE